ncbi:MAG: response regulator [Candidatus Woesebacteria bacterium]|nr:MAG: response regulator [Candidatus Woesebacteria bacterium]
MKGERIIHADDTRIAREGFSRVVEAWGHDDDQKIIGSASSLPEVEKLLEDGLKPTVAFIDNSFFDRGDGVLIANLVRTLSPDTIIVSLSADSGVKWGDFNLLKTFTGRELKNFLLELKHEQKSIFIDPARKQEYLGIIDQAFDAWHKREWFFVTKEYFTTISRASFLSYLQYLVSASDENGRIDLTATKAGLAEEMGEYFRQEKLDNALRFLEEDDWQGLIQK